MGRSFKGAAAYYLNDKPATDTTPGTEDRVAWTYTLNLPTDDPERAWRMMAHTALAQGVLKTIAGVKATGRKLEKPVLAYSLSWHPDERPTQDEQRQAATQSLQALGLQEHQAIIVCHTDEPHPHVHILVNRVHPMTGKAATLSKSKLALSHWAQAYEERHGRVFCHARVENNARRDSAQPGRIARVRTPRVSRREWEAGAPARPEADALRRQHADLFSVQAGRESRGARARAAENEAFRAGRSTARKACADRQAQAAKQAARPALTEAEARIAALLASDRPAAALDVLTRVRSTFTRAELERFIGRHTPDTASFAVALTKLDASPELVQVGHDLRGRVRFTTASHRALESRMIDIAQRLARAHQRKAAIPARFNGWQLSDDQMAALQHVLAPPRLAAVSGVAGTGKSTMLAAARQSWEAAGFGVQGMALAAEAAHGLQTGSGIKVAGTIHSRLYLWEQGRALPGPKDILVVDEAGMVGSRQMERLLHFAEKGGAKIVLVGDAQQLQAIEAGGAFRAIAARIGDVTLRTVRRQLAGWQREATGDLATGLTGVALRRYEAHGMVHAHATDQAARAALIAAWNAQRLAEPGRTQIVMAFLRRDVAELNALARARLRQEGTLGPDVTLATATGPQAFAINDRMTFLRNDATLGVRNGSLGTVEAIHGRQLTVRLDGDRATRVTFGLDAYSQIAHGYAATIHKSQGATVDRAHLYVSPNLDRHAAYVAMTRHRDRLDLHWSLESIPTRAKLAAILSRLALKDTSLDYDRAHATDRQARQDAADAMQARAASRASQFAEREQTQAGRLRNARSLSPVTATTLQIARLAFDAAERARLFRLRQETLRAWARRLMSAPLASPPRAARPAPPRMDAIHLHDRETLQLLAELQARHAAQRAVEEQARAALTRDAAANWQAEAVRGAAAAFVRRWTGFARTHWQAAQGRTANDNRPDPAPAPGLR